MITFEIYGIGFELSLGEIDKSKFEYWKDKEISEEEMNEDNDFRLFKNHWTDLSDIFHDNGPAMLENTKLEVKENNKIILYNNYGKQLLPQPIVRQVLTPDNKSGTFFTQPGPTGILINGVEILNFKSSKSVYHGKINNFEVIN